MTENENLDVQEVSEETSGTESMEVIEETSTGEETPEESIGTEEEEETGTGSSGSSGETVVVQTMDTSTLELYTGQIQETIDHPFMTTPLDDYTVTEGLLLLILLVLVLKWIGQAIKEGFYWLL